MNLSARTSVNPKAVKSVNRYTRPTVAHPRALSQNGLSKLDIALKGTVFGPAFA